MRKCNLYYWKTALVTALLMTVSNLVDTAAAAPVLIEDDVPIDKGYSRETVIRGLEHPWSLAWLPSGELLLTERPGRLRIVTFSADGRGQLKPAPVEGVPKVFARGQGGLLDITLHPDFVNNRQVYFSYAHGNRLANRTRVARAVLEKNRLRDLKIIFETNVNKVGTQHFGSRMLWLPDNTLLISVGDGGNPPVRLDGRFIREHAQDLSNPLGSVVRVTPDGSIPPDNPLTDPQGQRLAIFSYGHRNIQGIAYDTLRDKIWSTEHGALGGDELNQIQAGKNYGWPAVTYSREYFDGSNISDKVSRPEFQDPRIVWLSAIAPSGLALYTSDRFADWKGDLFAGALIKQSVRHIELDTEGKIVGQREVRVGARVRDVRQGPDGYLYVLTDEEDGQLIRLKPSQNDDDAP